MTSDISARNAQHQAASVVTKMREVLLDICMRRGAQCCANMPDPGIGNVIVGGGGGDVGYGRYLNQDDDDLGSFVVKLGAVVVCGSFSGGVGIAAIVLLAKILSVV